MIKESDWNERYHRPRRRRRRRGCLTRLVTTVLVLGLLVGWFWWQQNGLSSETITVSSAPDGFNGYRIAVVSDLHARSLGRGTGSCWTMSGTWSPTWWLWWGTSSTNPTRCP